MHIRENVHVHAHTKHITHIKCNTYQEVCVYAHENTHKHTLHCTVKHSIQTKKKLCVLFLNEISLRFSSSYYFSIIKKIIIKILHKDIIINHIWSFHCLNIEKKKNHKGNGLKIPIHYHNKLLSKKDIFFKTSWSLDKVYACIHECLLNR